MKNPKKNPELPVMNWTRPSCAQSSRKTFLRPGDVYGRVIPLSQIWVYDI